jgi:hypothetical protein
MYDATMRVMSDAIRFDFDFVSPNAYLAWTRLPALAERHGRALEPVPVLFAALLEAHGQLGPAEVPPKIRWMTRNNLRKAAVLGVELNPPAFHPFNPILALRVSSLVLDPSRRRALIDALFRAVWFAACTSASPAWSRRSATRSVSPAPASSRRRRSPRARPGCARDRTHAIARGRPACPHGGGRRALLGYATISPSRAILAGNDPSMTSWQRWAAGVAHRVRPRPARARVTAYSFGTSAPSRTDTGIVSSGTSTVTVRRPRTPSTSQ